MPWTSFAVWALWLALVPALAAQDGDSAAADPAQAQQIGQAQYIQDIAGAWDHLLTNVIPTAKTDPALVVEQTARPATGAADFFSASDPLAQ